MVDDVREAVANGQETFTIRVDHEWKATAHLDANGRERELLAAGGKLPHTREQFA